MIHIFNYLTNQKNVPGRNTTRSQQTKLRFKNVKFYSSCCQYERLWKKELFVMWQGNKNQEQTIENVMSFRVFPTKSKILNYLAIITRTWFSNEKLIISWFLRTILINILLVTYHLLFLCSPNKLPNRWNSQNSSALHSKSCNSHYMVDLLFSWRVIISYSLSKKSHNNKWLFFVKTLSNEDPLKFESLLTFFALLLE